MTIEFLRPDGTPEPVPEELLDVGPPRRPRRRMLVAVVVAGTVLLVAGILASVLRGGGHAAHPGAQLTHPEFVTGPAVVVTPGLSVSVDIPSSAPAVEVDGTVVAAAGGRLWWQLLDGTLSSSSDIDEADGYSLVADPAQHRVWALLNRSRPEIVVASSTGPARQFTFDMPGLAGAAVLDGQLYVTTDTGVSGVDTAGFGYSTRATPVRGGWGIAADPSRHRLLLMDSTGGQATLRAQRPTDARPEAQAALPIGKGSVVVVGGDIWAAGYGTDGAVLARLDPASLRVVAVSPAADELGPGAEVVGVGRHVLLVRSGGGGDGLWCVDARSGAIDEKWSSVPGAVAAGPDGGYELTGTRDAPKLLTGGRCPG